MEGHGVEFESLIKPVGCASSCGTEVGIGVLIGERTIPDNELAECSDAIRIDGAAVAITAIECGVVSRITSPSWGTSTVQWPSTQVAAPTQP